jgi:hypothetical protein
MISNEQTDLLELIQNASEMSEGLVRMDAVRRLKRCSLQRMDALALSEFARKAEDPGWRTTAAQVLGFHRVAKSYPDLVDGLVGAATVELDPEARKALVYAVRGTEGAARLIDHPQAEVAREATTGLPESEESWELILDALFSGLSPELESRVLRVIGRPDDSAAWVVGYLLNSAFTNGSDPTDRAALLFRVIDQGQAFTTLMDAQDRLERTHEQIWPGLARRARKRVLLELFTTSVCETGLDPSLAKAMADRVLTCRDFLTTQGRTLRSVLKGLSGRDGEQLMLVIAHTFDEYDRKGKLQLAEFMMMVGKEIPEAMGTVCAIVLDWKDAPPEMVLKVKQSRMGIR